MQSPISLGESSAELREAGPEVGMLLPAHQNPRRDVSGEGAGSGVSKEWETPELVIQQLWRMDEDGPFFR